MTTKTPEPVAPAEAPQMTPEQALGVLDRVCSQVALSRNDHQAVLDAVNVIAKAIGL